MLKNDIYNFTRLAKMKNYYYYFMNLNLKTKDLMEKNNYDFIAKTLVIRYI